MSRTFRQLLNTNIKDLWEKTDLVSGGADIGKTLWDLVVPLVSSATPLTQGVSAGLFVVGFAAKSIKFFGEKTKEKLLGPELVILAALFAYIESFKTLGNTDFANEKIENIVLSFLNSLKELEDFELREALAKDVRRCFHKSDLAKKFNGILETLLRRAGLSDDEAKILTKRVAWGTHRYLHEALASLADKVPAFAPFYLDGGRKENEKYHSLDEYLETQIATKPQETVFDKDFTFQQIYVPLEVKSVDENREVKEDAKSEDLEAWAKRLLLDPNKQNQVMFIQGGPGRGKSVFCRMFADQVRRELYPIWTPILIRLRDISNFESYFHKTLKEVINYKFVKNDEGWLNDKNTRYLFLLDGFDELVLERRNPKTLQNFLDEVGQFQKSCNDNPEMGHRVLITGRSLALHSIEGWLPDNIDRVEILPMNEALQQQWFAKWEAIVGETKNQEFQAFLKDKDCPDRVQELAKEPLLLYLLAAMHRDGEIQAENFAGVSSTNAKIVIYEKALDWVLTKQREASLNRKLTAHEKIEDLQRILTEAGLCVVQSGGECAAISMIKARLQSDDSAKALLEKAQNQSGKSALENALATFYLQTGSKEGSVEFCHKSFGEFLCAKRIKESLIDWTKPVSQRQKFYIPDDQFDWEIYDLLGYGGLTLEIVEYLTALLTSDGEFRPVELFQRLEGFYQRWCDGEFIDALPENFPFIDAPPGNLPQTKMRLLIEQVESIELGLRQVDIYAGLNVMILLLELNRYAQSQDKLKDQVVFYPCGKPDTENFDEQFRLGRIISYCDCIKARAFPRLVGAHLSGANLSHARLVGANLSRANLSRANLNSTQLSRADLSGANLSYADLWGALVLGADLSGANLSVANLRRANLWTANLNSANLNSANLRGANLSVADLSGANLKGANLNSTQLRGADLNNANLSRADLNGANLSDANFSRADLSGANLENLRWDANTKWGNVKGLETAQNVPEALKQQLGLS